MKYTPELVQDGFLFITDNPSGRIFSVNVSVPGISFPSVY
jgi:hypothetical protein